MKKEEKKPSFPFCSKSRITTGINVNECIVGTWRSTTNTNRKQKWRETFIFFCTEKHSFGTSVQYSALQNTNFSFKRNERTRLTIRMRNEFYFCKCNSSSKQLRMNDEKRKRYANSKFVTKKFHCKAYKRHRFFFFWFECDHLEQHGSVVIRTSG